MKYKEIQNNMKKTVIYTAILSAVLIFNSCTTTPICVTSSITPMNGRVIDENMGRVEGKDTAFSILGLYMIGRPDLDLAIKSALAAKGGDTLINVGCYETYGWFLLFSTTTVKVEGEAVKFTSADAGTGDKKNEQKKDKKK